MTQNTAVPIIDLGAMRSADPQRRDALAAHIWEASRDVGFYSVVNHGITSTLVADLFAQMQDFFDRPCAEKTSISNARSTSMRGYFGIGDETPERMAAGDLKEGFDMAGELSPDDLDLLHGSKLYGPNQWPSDAPEFRRTILQYHARMQALAVDLLGLYARAMGKPEDFFAPMLRKPLAQLRLLRYPPQDLNPDGQAIGCGEHTDYGAISLLSQDAPGLEVLGKDGVWKQVEVIDGAFVVNIGDLMARWTNDQLRANLHRVINRQATLRHSAAFFLDPDYDAVIEPIGSCVPAGTPPVYAPVVFGRYNEAKLDATFEFRRQPLPEASPL